MVMERRSKQEYGQRKNRDVRRQEILRVATDVFYEHGYHKASINDISKRLGNTKAAIYYHFSNKEEILYTIVDKISNELLLSFKSCSAKYKDPIERLHALIVTQISFMKSHKKEVKILIEDKRFLSGELRRLIKEKERTIFRLYRANMEELQKLGKLRDLDLTTATFGIFGMINWLYHWYNPNGRLGIEQLAKHIVAILLFGLLTDEAVSEISSLTAST
jgi:AcrR family transcriptional regulator